MKNVFKLRCAGLFSVLAMTVVLSVVVMLLWNALLPLLFGLPILTYWQALGILVLSKILFGGFGGGLFARGKDSRFLHHGNQLREKWMNMSEEERKAFIEKERDFFKFHKRFSHFNTFFDNAVPDEPETKSGPDA